MFGCGTPTNSVTPPAAVPAAVDAELPGDEPIAAHPPTGEVEAGWQ